MFDGARYLQDAIHGDKFAELGKYCWNDRGPQRRGEITESGIAFVKTDYLPSFFINAARSDKPVVLITHNSDMGPGIDGTMLNTAMSSHEIPPAPSTVVKWFAQNAEAVICHPVPIGLERPGIAGSGNTADFPAMNLRRWNLLYANFSDRTNECRPPLRAHLMQTGIGVVEEQRLEFKAFLNHLAMSKFVLCPPGNGSDCHRTWEALYCGAIPLCQWNHHNAFFAKILPIALYSKPEDITMEFLLSEEKRIMDRLVRGLYTLDALGFSWWKRIIEQYAWWLL